MTIKNHRKKEWRFYPHKKSKLYRGRCYIFKYKKDLMKMLNKNIGDAVNGEVMLEEKSFGNSGCIRQWFVWYNDYREINEPLKVELRQENFRGRKYIFKPSKISKENKKYFAFSDKVINAMCGMYNSEDKLDITPTKAKKLVELFYKRGFKDFTPNEDEKIYINSYLKEGIDFYYWSDRCNWLIIKTIIEYFKANNLI